MSHLTVAWKFSIPSIVLNSWAPSLIKRTTYRNTAWMNNFNPFEHSFINILKLGMSHSSREAMLLYVSIFLLSFRNADKVYCVTPYFLGISVFWNPLSISEIMTFFSAKNLFSFHTSYFINKKKNKKYTATGKGDRNIPQDSYLFSMKKFPENHLMHFPGCITFPYQ